MSSTKRMRGQYRDSTDLALNRSRRDFLKTTGALGGLAAFGPSVAFGSHAGSGMPDLSGKTLTIFHAGSLGPPFSMAESAFEKATGASVNRQAKGSVASTKKITSLGRRADVLGVSDYRLIRDRVLPDYGQWYAIFATNAMTIQYRPDSKGADEIGADNWWEILSRPGVRIGHSDPAVDPGGYRTVMAMQLGRIPFQGEALYDDATYQKLRDNSIVPTGTEVNLEGQLKAGKLDYVFYYQSISSTGDLPWINLQPQVDLSKATPEYAEHYGKAKVETGSGTFVGAPIAYGITVPSVAPEPEAGNAWVAFMLGKQGRGILEKAGFVPVHPAVVPQADADAVPDSVRRLAALRENLGPLAL